MPAALGIGEVEQQAIENLGLKRIDTSELTIERTTSANGFQFLRGSERLSQRDLKRISELTIPPAWTEVRIASHRDSHLQATGRDEAGRLQYIYHSDWEDVRAAAKAFRLQQIGQALPALRPRIAEQLSKDNEHLPLAAAASLVDLLHL